MYKIPVICFVTDRFFGGIQMKNKCYAITEIAGCGVIGVAAFLLRYLFRWFRSGGADDRVRLGQRERVGEEIKVFSGGVYRLRAV